MRAPANFCQPPATKARPPLMDPARALQGDDPTAASPLAGRAPLADALAVAFAYPDALTVRKAREAEAALAALAPEAAQALGALAAWIETDLRAAQERYTTLFDLMPVCPLHVGYHLFGEEYHRGMLLAGLREELARHGVEEGSELPDFLPTLLRLFARQAPDDRRLLARVVLVPALARMTTALSEADPGYRALLSALPKVVCPGAPLPEMPAETPLSPPDSGGMPAGVRAPGGAHGSTPGSTPGCAPGSAVGIGPQVGPQVGRAPVVALPPGLAAGSACGVPTPSVGNHRVGNSLGSQRRGDRHA